jgi:hypothetical protein
LLIVNPGHFKSFKAIFWGRGDTQNLAVADLVQALESHPQFILLEFL